ncbi:MAG: methylated-DNA--[protein]-cysteine S-methyltransferase [Pseudomonadota bacterium]
MAAGARARDIAAMTDPLTKTPPARLAAQTVDDRGAPPFGCVAAAIDYLVDHYEDAPSLEETAAHVGLSPAHFQRVFKAGAGVSPKRFLQFMAAGEAKRTLDQGGSLLDATLSAGLSGPSRLHDLFLAAEAMTPGAYKNKGAGLTIRYSVSDGPFGAALIGATDKGVCWLSFPGDGGLERSLREMKEDWPAAAFVEDADYIAPIGAKAFAFAAGRALDKPLGLHVQGTNFQLKVWEALLKIPLGACVTYGDIARDLGNPKGSRAVGTAVGANMISLLIPCHRVILSSGAVHNYRWGVGRKKAILAMESAIAAEAG